MENENEINTKNNNEMQNIDSDNSIDESSFVDFINNNFEDIKIAGCDRLTAYAWYCK